MIETLIASRRAPAAALAWLKEKPQGIYVEAEGDPPYAGVGRNGATPLLFADFVLFSPGRERAQDLSSVR